MLDNVPEAVILIWELESKHTCRPFEVVMSTLKKKKTEERYRVVRVGLGEG